MTKSVKKAKPKVSVVDKIKEAATAAECLVVLLEDEYPEAAEKAAEAAEALDHVWDIVCG